MATKNKITEMIAAVKTIYPYYAKDADVATLVKTWAVLLKDYPDDAVSVAFYKALQTCKMPPTPADVIENLDEMAKAMGQTDEELWQVYCDALRATNTQLHRLKYPEFGVDHRQKIRDIWHGLPEKIRQYIGSEGELMRMSRDYDSEDLKYERNRFFKNMPVIQKRTEYIELHLMLEGGANKLLTD